MPIVAFGASTWSRLTADSHVRATAWLGLRPARRTGPDSRG